jgi:hypothetical protein
MLVRASGYIAQGGRVFEAEVGVRSISASDIHMALFSLERSVHSMIRIELRSGTVSS